MKIFLDDIRIPSDCVSYMYKRIGPLNPLYLEDWVVVRNYTEFIKQIADNINQITHISFDHDLGGDVQESFRFDQGFSKRKARKAKQLLELPTGYDCAKWMKDFYRSKDKQYPTMFVHSMNPVGTQNIINLFK